ncbi:antitoxin Xre/MbcA/ParS toxin-binding domain-containing protein [Chitinophaga sp. NPDC101104]|uniref:antitoxin Xre/MbcA/ParS toxin-binding domain-containing protein n=1 Tax=Chitinophaga sp. NPDC101104 TaxID=3390561 RepID=UPI003D05481D
MDNLHGKGRRGRPRKSEVPVQHAQEEHMVLQSYADVVELRSFPFGRKIEMVRSGVSKDQLTRLKEIFGLDYDTLSVLLAVTNRSLHLKKGKERMNRGISDRLIFIADVFSVGYNVFGSREGFHAWLRDPSREFGDKTPLEVMDTLAGIEEVKNALYRIDAFIL